MNRAALFFDIDGTVLSEITKEIPASTVDALKRAHDAGHFLFINTGRTYCSVPVELKKLPFDGYLCGCGIYFTFDEEIIFDRTIEQNGLKKTANQMGKGIIAFSPLAQGLLTDKYLHGIPSDSRIAVDGRFLHADALTKEKLAQIEALNKMAGERGQSLAQMALSWILKDEDVTSVLIGASRPEQIIQNVEIVQNTKFTREELKKIDQISRGDL